MIEENAGQKKVVGRTVAMVLGLICIILAAGLVGMFAIYLSGGSNATELATLKAENADLQDNVTSLNTQLSYITNLYAQTKNSLDQLTADYADLQNYTASLEDNNYTSYLENLLQLGASAYILQNQAVQLDAGENMTLYSDTFLYAGYLAVQVTSTSNTTFAQLIYSFLDVDFNNTVVLGEEGTTLFPILPTEFAFILGNTETTDAVNATVSVSYVY